MSRLLQCLKGSIKHLLSYIRSYRQLKAGLDKDAPINHRNQKLVVCKSNDLLLVNRGRLVPTSNAV
jgi:hypothetical protein